MREVGGEIAEPYRMTQLAPEVRLFSDASAPQSGKALVMAFCGTSNRMMVPSALFLQSIPASKFDVAIITDRSNSSYELGLVGIGLPFVALVRNIAGLVGADRYREVYCMGGSMGGFPALRAGRLLGAKRSIAIGGSFAWSINRLRGIGRPPLSSFDPLCSCAAAAPGELVAAYTAFPRDMQQAERLRRMVPVRLMPFPHYKLHNLVYSLIEDHKFGHWLAEVLDFDPALVHRRRRLTLLQRLGIRAWDGVLAARRHRRRGLRLT